jgi:hypothetical protein
MSVVQTIFQNAALFLATNAIINNLAVFPLIQSSPKQVFPFVCKVLATSFCLFHSKTPHL